MGLPGRISCRVPEKQRCTHYDILLKGEGVEPSNTSSLPQDNQPVTWAAGQVQRASLVHILIYIAAGRCHGEAGSRAKLPVVDSEIGSRSSRKRIVETGRSRRAVSADVLQLAR